MFGSLLPGGVPAPGRCGRQVPWVNVQPALWGNAPLLLPALSGLTNRVVAVVVKVFSVERDVVKIPQWWAFAVSTNGAPSCHQTGQLGCYRLLASCSVGWLASWWWGWRDQDASILKINLNKIILCTWRMAT